MNADTLVPVFESVLQRSSASPHSDLLHRSDNWHGLPLHQTWGFLESTGRERWRWGGSGWKWCLWLSLWCWIPSGCWFSVEPDCCFHTAAFPSAPAALLYCLLSTNSRSALLHKMFSISGHILKESFIQNSVVSVLFWIVISSWIYSI